MAKIAGTLQRERKLVI